MAVLGSMFLEIAFGNGPVPVRFRVRCLQLPSLTGLFGVAWGGGQLACFLE